MNLVSDMLYRQLDSPNFAELTVSQLRPSMRCRLSKSRDAGMKSKVRNLDRAVNRFFDYPRWIRNQSRNFDLFHIVDHSYAQLVHELPQSRTVVTCHDLDTFRCILEPSKDRRDWLFRQMAQRILNGLKKAAHVLCDSNTIRQELLSYRLLPPERVSVVTLGVESCFSPLADKDSDDEAARILAVGAEPYLLHVGSTIPRKRIEILLRVFAAIRKQFRFRLVRVGGRFTNEQDRLIDLLGIRDSITVLPFISRPVLASVYRSAELMMLPSSFEGFGLPLLEARACGCPVVATDIPVLREIGGSETVFCPVDDLSKWTDVVSQLLTGNVASPDAWRKRRLAAIQGAAQFSWERSAAGCMEVYRKILKLN